MPSSPSRVQALRLVPIYQPNVVLLDLALPPGNVVLEHLRQVHPGLPVIIVTGNVDGDLARGILANGAFDYVANPFGLEISWRASWPRRSYRG